MAISRLQPNLALTAFGAALLTPGARTQAAYPNKPIRLVVGFPPGGETAGELLARQSKVVQQRLAAEARKALASAEITERFASLGMDDSVGGPDEPASAIAGDLTPWRPVIKAAGIRAEWRPLATDHPCRARRNSRVPTDAQFRRRVDTRSVSHRSHPLPACGALLPQRPRLRPGTQPKLFNSTRNST